MKRKQLLVGCGSFLGMLLLILDAKTALQGARSGIDLCLQTVIPSLFPFFVLSAFLTDSVSDSSGAMLGSVERLFGVPKGAGSLLLTVFLAGYPVGAQCVADAWRRGQLSKTEAERMLAFCSNPGPAFLFGMVGSLFPSMGYVWLIWGLLILGAWLTALTLPSASAITMPSRPVPRSGDMPSLLKNATNAMVNVCCWVILFRILIHILKKWVLWFFPPEGQALLSGILELTNGCMELFALDDLGLRFFLVCGFLSFGGLCVAMQILSAAGGLSMKLCVFGKAIQTFFCLCVCAALVWRMWYPLAGFLLVTGFLCRKNRKRSGNHRAVVV